MTPARLVALATVLLARKVEPCSLAEAQTGPIRLPVPVRSGRHRAPRGWRPVIGECTPPLGMPGAWHQ